MTHTAPSGTVPRGGPFGPAPWSQDPRGAWNPWTLVWSAPKKVLVIGVVLAFVLFWPLGLAALFFLLGSGRLGGRWAAAAGAPGAAPAAMCGPRGWRREEAMAASGNTAFDEYRLETLRRLEQEQQDFAAFLERLRVAKDKAEFDQFMADRRRQRPDAPPDAETPPAGRNGG
jgi:hypothetical protein